MDAKKIQWKGLLSLVMIFIYLAMAAMLAFTEIFKDSFSPTLRYLFAAFLGIYGFLRAYRLWKSGI